MDYKAIKNAIQRLTEELLPITFAAKLLGISPMTLRRWDKLGTLKAIRLRPTGRRYYRRGDIMFFVEREKSFSKFDSTLANPSKHHVVKLCQFGTDLSTTQDGKRAWKSFEPSLRKMNRNDTVEIDFDGVENFMDEWAQEFLVPLHALFGNTMTIINIHPSKLGFLTVLELCDIYKHPYDLAREEALSRRVN